MPDILKLLCLLLLCSGTHQSTLPKSISIRGHPQPQMLPAAHCTSWPVWTCDLNARDGQILELVDEDADEGWVNPTSFDSLFYPSDLPLPLARPAIGIAMANGSPRYLMPSVVLTLETPSKVWRNRGLCSIPRARAWIDMFAAFASPVEKLRLSSFGQLVPDIRFLEDQDGASAWTPLDQPQYVGRSLLRPVDSSAYEIASTFDLFKKLVLSQDGFDEIKKGYHFIDIPLLNVPPIRLPTSRRFRQFLTDFEQPRRLLEIEDSNGLDVEPCGELDVTIQQIGAGGDSKFLPEVYRELYEEGNIVMQ